MALHNQNRFRHQRSIDSSKTLTKLIQFNTNQVFHFEYINEESFTFISVFENFSNNHFAPVIIYEGSNMTHLTRPEVFLRAEAANACVTPTKLSPFTSIIWSPTCSLHSTQ
jgi:hypothetical protein